MSQSALNVSPIHQVEASPVPDLPFERLPQPDYDAHPAYGRAFEKPPLALRIKALTTLAPWLGLVFAKRLMLFDRLPALPDYSGPMSGGVLGRAATVPRYVPLVARAVADQVRRKVLGSREVPKQAEEIALLGNLRDRGIAMARMPAPTMSALNGALDQPITKLVKRREAAGKTTFEGNQIWLNKQEFPNVYALLDRALADCGVFGAAAGYLGRRVKVSHLTLQINDARDGFHHNKFADVGATDPATNYMHVDTSYEILKCMIYLNEVTDLNGPFCYVLGSSKLKVGPLEGLVRRSIDRSGLVGYAPATRKMFMALPRPLRKKSTFGSDLLDGSPEVNALVAAEYHATSADGNVVLFDNLGVHRGALVRKGERRILVATIA